MTQRVRICFPQSLCIVVIRAGWFYSYTGMCLAHPVYVAHHRTRLFPSYPQPSLLPPGADLQLVSSPAAPSECTTVHNQRKTQSRVIVMIGNFVEHLFCDSCTCTSPTKPTDTSNYAHQCTSAEKNMILGIWLVSAEQFCRGLHHSARILGLCKWVGFDEISEQKGNFKLQLHCVFLFHFPRVG